MDTVYNHKELLTALVHAKDASDPRSVMPILGCVLLTSDGELSATTLYRSVRARTGATPAADGGTVVNVKDLLDRVRNLPGPEVRVRITGTVAELSSPGSARRFRLHTVSPDEFPAVPVLNGTSSRWTLESDVLRELIECTAFAVSTDETRLHLNSALLEIGGCKICMVSTDGHRLAFREIVGEAFVGSASVLIPLGSLQQIRKVLPKTGTVEIAIDGGNLFVVAEGVTFSAKLADVQFPPYDQVIPKQTEHTVRIDRNALLSAVQAVAVSANDAGAITLSFKGCSVQLSAESASTGDAGDTVELLDGDVSNTKLGICAAYLIGQLSAFQDETIELSFSGELDPIIVRQSESAMGVIMPLRLS
jgi:DNA polymerase III subunit beta